MQLKILACNISGGTLSGAINMNGRPLHAKELRRQSTIVWQRDLLLSTATVCLHRLKDRSRGGFPSSDCDMQGDIMILRVCCHIVRSRRAGLAS